MKINFLAIALFSLAGLLAPACSTIKEVGKIESFPSFRGFNPIDPMELSSERYAAAFYGLQVQGWVCQGKRVPNKAQMVKTWIDPVKAQ